ncbi:MAG: hypothetical protein ACI83P_000268 [Janthinobacterium sp.]|jgi:hypothetical protein
MHATDQLAHGMAAHRRTIQTCQANSHQDRQIGAQAAPGQVFSISLGFGRVIDIAAPAQPPKAIQTVLDGGTLG